MVYGASLLEDLSRRDFTVNAMAMDPRGKLLDPFSGRKDLERGILRAAGNPWERFREDRIRVVRAARFAAHLEASIEEATWEAALQMGPRVLETVSLPRIGDEFTKGLIKGRGRFVLLAQEMGFLYKLFPELVGPYGPAHLLRQNPQHHPEGDVLSHLAQVVDRMQPPLGADPGVAVWSAFLHDVGKPMTAQPTQEGWYRFPAHEAVGAEMIPAIARRLGFSCEWERSVEKAVRLHMRPLQPPTPKAVRRFQAEAGEHLPLLEALCRADGEGRREALEAWFAPQEMPLKPLVQGRDLLEMGFAPGPEMGKLLRKLYEFQVEEGKGREELLALARGVREAGRTEEEREGVDWDIEAS